MSVGMLCVRPEPASAALVRERISEDLASMAVTRDSVADVVLVASELVGNAVVHAGSVEDLDIAWDLQDGTVIVRVNDGSTEPPALRDAAPTAGNGRGLAIVAALAQEWGVQQLSQGKQVWARIAVAHAI